LISAITKVSFIGITAQVASAGISDNSGAMMNRKRLDSDGMITSLNSSLKTSANGCSKPSGPTRFGPTRDCMLPITLRSKYVEYATTSTTPISTIRILKLEIVTYWTIGGSEFQISTRNCGTTPVIAPRPPRARVSLHP
jgi:hypothetical protein